MECIKIGKRNIFIIIPKFQIVLLLALFFFIAGFFLFITGLRDIEWKYTLAGLTRLGFGIFCFWCLSQIIERVGKAKKEEKEDNHGQQS